MDNVKVFTDSGSDIVQFSVLIDNTIGSVLRITKLIQSSGVIMLAMNLLDNSDTGILRFIVNYPEVLTKHFEKNKINFSKQSVLCVELSNSSNIIALMQGFFEMEISLHYIYPFFINTDNNTAFVVSVEHLDLARSILGKIGVNVMSSKDIAR